MHVARVLQGGSQHAFSAAACDMAAEYERLAALLQRFTVQVFSPLFAILTKAGAAKAARLLLLLTLKYQAT